MANNSTFQLTGKLNDQITKKLKGINEEIKSLNKLLADFGKSTQNITKEFTKLSSSFEDSGRAATRSFSKMTGSLEDAGKAAGKVRDTVSQIGEGVKGLDGISESLGDAARAAQKTGESVEDIGVAAGRANKQADDLVTTLLKANGMVKMGEGLSKGFDRGMGTILSTAQQTAGLVGKIFKDSMDDEMADIKAAGGIEGSFRLAGFEGSFKDSQKMYKKYDQVVSEMIRQSSAPTAKVVELQRYTLDTIGPLMLAAEGVAKGTAMKNIDPTKITASAKNYGAFLEKAALFSQGTGTAGFRVAAGIEQLVTRGKIDTTIDFFTDNIMLMKNLEKAGFMGRKGGGGSGKMMTATDAERMAAMMDAFNNSMSGESTKAMASSLTGSLQGLNDTIMNPSVGILGMSVTFSKKEQLLANAAINRIQNKRIVAYQDELAHVETTEKRKEQLRANIEQATTTRDQLTKDGVDEISTPFKAFSYAFSTLIRSLTGALNAIGPVWTSLSLGLIDFTEKVFGPLGITLTNVASDMRSGGTTQAQGFGRIIGEVFKTIGEIMGDIATMITNPEGALGKLQSEFLQGFMEAFKEPGSLRKAQQQLERGIWAFIDKLKEILLLVLSAPEMRPFVLTALALAFGPPLISAIIMGATPLILGFIGKTLFALGKKFLFSPEKIVPAVVKEVPKVITNPARLLSGSVPFGPAPPPVVVSKMGTMFAQVTAVGEKMAGFFKTFGGKLTIVGAVLTTIVSLFSGEGLAASLAVGAGPALGTALGFALGGPIGAFIGGWLGSLKPVTDTLTGIFEGVGAALSTLGAILSDSWNLIVDIFGTWFSTIGDLIRVLFPFTDGLFKGAGAIDLLHVALVATKVVLTPIVAAFQLLRGALNYTLLALLHFQQFMHKLSRGGMGDKTLDEKIKKQETKIDNDFKQDMAWYNTPNPNKDKNKNKTKPTSNAPAPVAPAPASSAFTVAANAGLGAATPAVAVVPQINTSPANKALATYTEAANAASSAQAVNTTKLTTAQANQIATLSRINTSWATSNVNSQAKLQASAAALASSINAAAAKITNASGGAKGGVDTTNGAGVPAKPKYGGNIGTNLMGAIQSEMANKPSGSDLVIANSSETIIPAAGGLNLGPLASGLDMFTSGVNALGKLADKLSALTSLGGGSAAGVDSFTPIASGYGLQVTSGYRKGDPGWHGANRARDYSNSTGPTPQMMQFARAIAGQYGSNLKELIYTPLGFSIKNGAQVAPYAQGAHYNHVHVAYALREGTPAFFNREEDARNWESKMMPPGARVRSITSNTSEGSGAMTVNAPITIHQQPGQNSEQMALAVAKHLSDAITHARSTGIQG
jgi:hypothetical protein